MKRMGQAEEVAGLASYLMLILRVTSPARLFPSTEGCYDRRVVITGMGGVTAFGENWQEFPRVCWRMRMQCAKCRSGRLRWSAHPAWRAC